MNIEQASAVRELHATIATLRAKLEAAREVADAAVAWRKRTGSRHTLILITQEYIRRQESALASEGAARE